MFAADAAERGKFGFGVERAVFGGVRNIRHTGEDHVFVISVRVKIGKVGGEAVCIHFALVRGQGQHFAPRVFNRARFVHAYVPGLC